MLRQSLLWASIPKQKIFLTCFNPSINNLSPATFMFQLWHSFSLLQIQHKPYFLLVLIPTQTIFPTCFNPNCPRQAILDTSVTFHLSVFIQWRLVTGTWLPNSVLLCNKNTALGDRQQFYPCSLSIKKYFSFILVFRNLLTSN